jgi:hypothetical protein
VERSIAVLLILLAIFVAGIFMRALLYLVLSVLIPKLVRSHGFGFGGESFLDNVLNDVGIELTPRGCRCEEIVEVRASSGKGTLNHSAFMENKGFISEAGKWIERKAKAHRPSRAQALAGNPASSQRRAGQAGPEQFGAGREFAGNVGGLPEVP